PRGAPRRAPGLPRGRGGRHPRLRLCHQARGRGALAPRRRRRHAGGRGYRRLRVEEGAPPGERRVHHALGGRQLGDPGHARGDGHGGGQRPRPRFRAVRTAGTRDAPGGIMRSRIEAGVAMNRTSTIGDDITVEALTEDPYPIYAELRRSAPVCYVPAVDLWFVTRWADVIDAAENRDHFPASMPDSPLDRTLGGANVLTVDGASHAHMRDPMETTLRPKAVEERAPEIV